MRFDWVQLESGWVDWGWFQFGWFFGNNRRLAAVDGGGNARFKGGGNWETMVAIKPALISWPKAYVNCYG